LLYKLRQTLLSPRLLFVMQQVRNRAPAPIQITAEQILREAKDKGIENVKAPPKQFISDKEELAQYQQAKRKDFENQIRRQRNHIGTWCNTHFGKLL